MKINISKLYLLLPTIPILFFVFIFFLSVFLVKNKEDKISSRDHFAVFEQTTKADVVSSRNNFNIVIITVKNIGMRSSDDMKFQILLDDQVVRSVDFSASNTGDPGDVRIQFDPIPDSAQKKYKIVLGRAGNDAEEIQVMVDHNGEMSYETYYQRTINLQAFTSELKYFLVKVGQDKPFFVFWAASLVMISYSIYRVYNCSREPRV